MNDPKFTLWRDRKVLPRTELQERHTTTLCHAIHVSFQRSLDSHCVATFRYLSIMIWWFCCPSWMSSSDPLDLTTPFLIWVQVPQIPLKAYDSGPGCVKSWLRGWGMDSSGVYKIYHSMFEVTFPPIPNHPIISDPIILGSGMEHEEQGFMDLRLIPKIDPQKHYVFNSEYVSVAVGELRSQNMLANCWRANHPCDSCDTFSFLFRQSVLSKKGIFAWYIASFNHVAHTLDFLLPALGTFSFSTDLHSWWSLLN